MEEIWREIHGFEKIYQISNLGRVASVNRSIPKTNKLGKKYQETKSGKILSAGDNGKGYLFVNLRKNNKSKQFYIHRLVATAFIANPENKPCVNHINGIKADNKLENLEWCTHSENTTHGYKSNLIKTPIKYKGLDNGNSKFSKEDVLSIRKSYSCKEKNQVQLATAYNVSQCVISRIVLNKSYKELLVSIVFLIGIILDALSYDS